MDDDEVDFVITRKLLGQVPSQDYELEWAASFEEGLEALARTCHDACLVDYRLGPKSGLDLLRQSSARGWSVPMILLTGQGGREVDAEALALGAVGYLEKSRLGVGELDRALRYALAREGLVTELIEHNTELLSMHHITSHLLGGGSIEERAGLALEELTRPSGFPSSLLETCVGPARLRTLAAHGLARRDVPEPEHALDASPAAEALASRRPVVVSALGPRPRTSWPWVRAMMALPLEVAGESIGAITLASPEERAIDSEELGRSAALASHLARMLRFAAPEIGT